jgi:hypothetical protein
VCGGAAAAAGLFGAAAVPEYQLSALGAELVPAGDNSPRVVGLLYGRFSARPVQRCGGGSRLLRKRL